MQIDGLRCMFTFIFLSLFLVVVVVRLANQDPGALIIASATRQKKITIYKERNETIIRR